MDEPDGTPIPGVRSLDHTADVGLKLEAPDLPELFHRAALGTMWLVLDRPPEAGGEGRDGGEGKEGRQEVDGDPWTEETAESQRDIDLVEEDLPGLLRSWLRTLLFWEEVEGYVTVGGRLKLLPAPQCGAPDGQAFSLQGRVNLLRDEGARAREIKGVTLHGLELHQDAHGWKGQVIFDV